MTTALPLRGLLPALHTPMHPDRRLNLDQAGPLVDHLVRDGACGLFACGTTGEGPSLTLDERRATAAAFLKAAEGRLPVVVHVGHASLREAQLLARHAQEIGAQATAATPPYYFKPATLEALVDCAAEIARGAPELPFFYYHIPSLTGVSLPMPDFMRRASERIPNFAGVKFTSPVLHEFQACLAQTGGRTDVLFGVDEMLLSGLVAGGFGAIGSTYNFAAPLYHGLRAAFERGDLAEARRAQSKSIELVEILSRHGFLPASKAVMRLVGIDCGPTRLPLVPLDAAGIGALEKDLRSIGFFDWGRSRSDVRVR